MKKVENLYSKLKKALMVAGGSLYMTFASANYVLADTGVGQVDAGLNTIKSLACGIVGMIGVIVLVKGAMDLGSAISQRDSSGMGTAAGELAGGLIMASVTAVIALLV